LLSTPKLMETARSYYGCPNVQGMEVENDGQPGTIGSHWERTIMNNEIMIVMKKRGFFFLIFLFNIYIISPLT
jgi:hypothetical protein